MREQLFGLGASPCPRLGRTVAKRTNAETDRGGRIKVNSDLTIPNYPDITVIGDLALVQGPNGKPLPGVAQVAMQQGTYAAKAIVRKLRGETEIKSFKYFDKGDMAVIGRWAAVANIFGRPSFRVRSVAYLGVHPSDVSRPIPESHSGFHPVGDPGLTFNRGARLITGPVGQ